MPSTAGHSPVQPPSIQPLGELTLRPRAFGKLHGIALAVLAVCLVICAVFFWITRDAMNSLPSLQHTGQSASSPSKTLVDLRPWQTALSLEPLAVTSEEIELARNAEHIADHEVDQAFATALRLANTDRPPLTPDALALQQRIQDLQQAVEVDQRAVAQLTPATNPAIAHTPESNSNKSPAPEATAEADSNDLALAKAQLGLDSDQLDEAQLDFAQITGDQRDRIQQELALHEATMQQYDAGSHEVGQTAVASAKRFSTLAGRLSIWMAQRSRYTLIQQALMFAQQDAANLAAERNTLAKSNPDAKTADAAPADTAGKLAALQARFMRHQLLGIYSDRIQSQQQLASVYKKWSTQVLLQHQIVLHLLMQSIALIIFILVCVILSTGLVRRLFGRPSLDPRSAQTLRTIIQFVIQFAGALCILVVLFGVPSQMPTILGFATAGLTVALQQFILAFIGWFILLGRNGIRVGDTVEINGVGGEVAEINLFRTTLLETGNLTDKGHPTGRRVTFVNNFAVTGQYFNFSTAGQWMWDEITVNVPASPDSYQVIERIHQTVVDQTKQDVALAQREWKSDQQRHSVKQYTAVPGISLRPAGAGTDVLIRYVTRASERLEIRNRIYESILEVLHPANTAPQVPA
jgi:small-conductance mechanosensitive channel